MLSLLLWPGMPLSFPILLPLPVARHTKASPTPHASEQFASSTICVKSSRGVWKSVRVCGDHLEVRDRLADAAEAARDPRGALRRGSPPARQRLGTTTKNRPDLSDPNMAPEGRGPRLVPKRGGTPELASEIALVRTLPNCLTIEMVARSPSPVLTYCQPILG